MSRPSVLATGSETLDLPRLLCLHGAGVSGEVFSLQSSWLKPALIPRFRLVFADGPRATDGHPDLYPVYSDLGPFYSWTRWREQQEKLSPQAAADKIRENLQKSMATDPGTGEWVGLLGFSQGARICISILLEDQLRRKANANSKGLLLGVDWKFGVMLASSAPPYSLSDLANSLGSYATPDVLPTDSSYVEPKREAQRERLSAPTLHICGTSDAATPGHENLVNEWCEDGTAEIIYWDGAHRLPTQKSDIALVAEEILKLAVVCLSANCPFNSKDGQLTVLQRAKAILED